MSGEDNGRLIIFYVALTISLIGASLFGWQAYDDGAKSPVLVRDRMMIVKKNLSHRTAIARSKPSAPTLFLKTNGDIKGKVLDYGCGRGRDCQFLECDGYDPHYRPEMPTGKYDTILCNYVLNVIPSRKVRQQVLDKIEDLLAPDGSAYITVRRGKGLNGWTSIGTYQTLIELDLPIHHRTSAYAIYKI
jgi:SAM-dependent methyltransferase